MKKIIIILLLISVAIGIGAYFIIFPKESVWNIQYNIDTNTTNPTYEQQKLDILEKNKENVDLYNTAVKEQNPKLCESIENNDMKHECHDILVATTAQKTGTIETCDTLTATGIATLCRDTIKSDRAVSSDNKDLCEEISHGDRKLYCQEQIDEKALATQIKENTITKEFCGSLSEKYQKDCITRIIYIDEDSLSERGIAENDITLCKQITDIELKNFCTDTVNFKTAIHTQNSLLCEKLINTKIQTDCLSQLSKISDKEIYISAINTQNIDTCSKIEHTDLQNKCHDTILLSQIKMSKDASLCINLTNTGIIASCQQIGQ